MTARKPTSIDATASDESELGFAYYPSLRRRIDFDSPRAESRCDLSRAYVRHKLVPQIEMGCGLAIPDTSPSPDREEGP